MDKKRPELRSVPTDTPEIEQEKVDRVLGVVRGAGIDWRFLHELPAVTGNPFYEHGDDLPPAA